MTPDVAGDRPRPAPFVADDGPRPTPSLAGDGASSAGSATPGGGSLCSAEHAGWLATPLRRLLHDPRRILAGLAAPGETVIDYGCGPGFFTLPLAEIVGPDGRVVAVDLQPAMLERLRLRAEKAGLAGRITLHACSVDGLGELPPAHAALAFYMVHEVPDVARFLAEVSGALRPGGRFLLVEPRGHVSAGAFAATVSLVEAAGLRRVGAPRVRLSRTTLFAKG
jgi:SAM-dependent methyltransferase